MRLPGDLKVKLFEAKKDLLSNYKEGLKNVIHQTSTLRVGLT